MEALVYMSKRPEVVSVLYFFYFLANGDRTESCTVQLRHPLQTVHPPNEVLAGIRMELR